MSIPCCQRCQSVSYAVDPEHGTPVVMHTFFKGAKALKDSLSFLSWKDCH